MFRPKLAPIANEVTVRIYELQSLASIASQKFSEPVIFVFDTKSTWSIHAEAFAEATGYPKEFFLPNSHERFTVGYCSWLLCEYAAKNLPAMEEEILAPCEPGRARMLNFFEVSGVEKLTAGNLLTSTSYLS